MKDFLASKSDPAWFLSLWRLITRADERSYRHVRARLVLNNELSWTDPWTDPWTQHCGFKPQRRDDYGPLLDKLAVKLSEEHVSRLDGMDRLCVVCRDLLGGPDAPNPVALPCSPLHALCRDCLLTWCQSSRSEAACPICRARIFTDQQEVEDVVFGLKNGVYVYDSRFTAWENFERSCADLDRKLFENDRSKHVVSARVLLHAWKLMKRGALLEKQESTPYHLQPVRFPELAIAEDALNSHCSKHDGQEVVAADFFRSLLNSVAEWFCIKCEVAGYKGRVAGYEGFFKEEGMIIQPSLLPHLRRTFNRVFRFQDLRRCQCDSASFHEHGARVYYNPDRLAVLSMEDSSSA